MLCMVWLFLRNAFVVRVTAKIKQHWHNFGVGGNVEDVRDVISVLSETGTFCAYNVIMFI